MGTNMKSAKDWEDDVSLPMASNIKKLCAILGTTADYLLEIDDQPVVVLRGLSPSEAIRARAILQTFMDTSPSDAKRTENNA